MNWKLKCKLVGHFVRVILTLIVELWLKFGFLGSTHWLSYQLVNVFRHIDLHLW